jgi:hypothetical protein
MCPTYRAKPTTGPSLKLALLLGAAAAIATLALQPYLLMMMPSVMRRLPVPFWIIAILQAGIPCMLLGWLGLSMGRPYGLDAPWLRAFVYGQPRDPAFKPHWGLAVLLGVLVGALVVVLMMLGPRVMPTITGLSGVEQAWRGALATFYGGLVEEILLRLFAVSLLVWLMAWFNRGQTGPWMFVVAIVLAASLFGAGHLPAALEMGTTLTPQVIGWTVLVNALVALLTGTLFWKHGLEHAMLAHFCADMVIHVALPLAAH